MRPNTYCPRLEMYKKLMWMVVHMYSSVNAKFRTGNIWDKDMTT